MTYSQSDILQRIKTLLPARWFGSATPVLDSVVTSLAAGWVGIFELLDYTSKQTRISTAFDFWLDLIAGDFFGGRVSRRPRETDTSFRARVSKELRRDRCTRVAVSDLLEDLTGRTPAIFEPTNPQDTGAYASMTSPRMGVGGYGAVGGWGSLNVPFQVFVKAFRHVPTSGVAMVNGWCQTAGAYGIGASAYSSLEISSSQPSDANIYREICRIAPVGTVVWVSIEP